MINNGSSIIIFESFRIYHKGFRIYYKSFRMYYESFRTCSKNKQKSDIKQYKQLKIRELKPNY